MSEPSAHGHAGPAGLVLSGAHWPQVDRARRDVLVVPVGSVEQHGPHLPLDTDTTVAAAVSSRVAALRPGAGLAPAVAIGASGEHADFPGTLSVGTEAVRLLVVELVRHAARDWRGVLVVNGHGGNADALAAALDLSRREGRRLAVVHLAVPGADAHAGRTETSLMLHLDPSRVRRDLAEPGVTRPLSSLLPVLRRDGVRAVSPNGVLGDPSGASADEGAELLEALVRGALTAYDALAADGA